jgi:hypothetical protein
MLRHASQTADFVQRGIFCEAFAATDHNKSACLRMNKNRINHTHRGGCNPAKMVL